MARVVRRAHAQRREVVHRLPERLAQVVPRGADLRDAQLPGGDRFADPRALLAEVALDHLRRTIPAAVRAEADVDAQRPRLPRRERDVVADPVPVRVAALREDHLRPAEPVGVDEHELVVLLVVRGRDRARQRLRVRRIAEREVPLLDRDDVGEVRGQRQLEPELERLRRLVRQLDVILHPVADEPLALDQHRVERQAVRERVAEKVRGREVLDGAGREQQGPLAVDRELEPREKARVVGEEPVRRVAHVAELVADAEGGAFEDRLLRHGIRATARAGSARPTPGCAP